MLLRLSIFCITMPTSKKVELLRERLKSSLTLLAFDVAFSGNNKIDSNVILGLVKKLGFVLAPARTRLARKQNAGLLVGSPSFADTASRSRSQPKMEDNLFTSPKGRRANETRARSFDAGCFFSIICGPCWLGLCS